MPSIRPVLDELMFNAQLIEAGLDYLVGKVVLEDQGLLRRSKKVLGSMTVFGPSANPLDGEFTWAEIGTVFKTRNGWQHSEEPSPLFRDSGEAGRALLEVLLAEKARIDLAEMENEMKDEAWLG